MPEALKPEPKIRRAGAGDVQALSAIGIETFVETFGHLYPPSDLEDYLAEAYSLDRTRADLADPTKASWLVEADGEVIGYALAGLCGLPHPEVTPDCGELKRIYLRKAWQAGGLGGQLFGETIAWLLASGSRTLWIGVWSENHGALRFYGRRGFEKAGEYGFKVGNTVDHEYILRRKPDGFATRAAETA